MKMSLTHLPVARRKQLQTITRIITEAIHPEKIILFGIFGSKIGRPDFYASSQLPAFVCSYNILVIMRKEYRRQVYEVQDLVENLCRIETPVTVLVHDIEYVNNRLSEGRYFFSMLYKEGVLLYDACTVPLVEGLPPDLPKLKILAQNDFDRLMGQAKAFLKSVLFNIEQKEWKVAVFLLHQAAENTYQTILRSFTGYKPCTHNLDKLRRYTNRFSFELAFLFPRNTEREDRFFKLLQQGYSNARYKEDYMITEDELRFLIERISQLLSIATRICKNRFASLDKMAASRYERFIERP